MLVFLLPMLQPSKECNVMSTRFSFSCTRRIQRNMPQVGFVHALIKIEILFLGVCIRNAGVIVVVALGMVMRL